MSIAEALAITTHLEIQGKAPTEQMWDEMYGKGFEPDWKTDEFEHIENNQWQIR